MVRGNRDGPKVSMRIGIDLGGTKVEAIALDPSGRELARLRTAAPAGDYPGILAVIADLVAALEQRTGETGSVGVGIPGTLSPATGVVKNANSTLLIGRPLDKDLETALGRPVRLANDANCFAVSEAADGAGAGHHVVFGVILGTGVGGGLVVGGRILTGSNAVAGEWGHNPLPWPRDDERPGPPCYCGKRGCIESFLCGPGLARDYLDHGGAATLEEGATAKAVADLAEVGNAIAAAALARYEERLARALATVINLVDPDVIVLGGGLSNVERLYENVPRLWQDWVFSDRTDTPLRKNRHGDSSGVRGAAWLWS